jgi:excisionase family DNA binding protein
MTTQEQASTKAAAPGVRKSYCTTAEAAEILGVSPKTIQLWVEGCILEAWKTQGGHRRILRQSITALLDMPGERAEKADRAVFPKSVTPRQMRILVVEDDDVLQHLYEARLSTFPMRPKIVIASDGYEALIRLGHFKPDLLIADLQLPGMDGFRMLRTIRSTPELEGLEIVVVSALKSEEIERRGGLPTDIPVLAKPISFGRLLEFAEPIANALRQ